MHAVPEILTGPEVRINDVSGYRVTIVFKNAAIANDNFDSSTIIKLLHPDQETYKKEE